MKRNGFTLVEITVAAIIIGILLLIGIPNLLKSSERSYSLDVMRNLVTIHAAQQEYALNNNNYFGSGAGSSLSAINSNLNINIVASYGAYNCYSPGSVPSPLPPNPSGVCVVWAPKFTMKLFLNVPVRVGSSPVYCGSNPDFNPCCHDDSGTRAGALCPS